MKNIRDVLKEALNEGILDMEDMDARIDQLENAALIDSVFKKYHCSPAGDCHWSGGADTLSFRFRESGYADGCFLNDFQNVADELGCKSFKIYPRAEICNAPSLKNLRIETTGGIAIDDSCKIENCEFKCWNMWLTPSDQDNVNIKHTTIDAENLFINKFNKFNFQGSNFDKVERLPIRRCGSDIQKIVDRWNFCEIKYNRIIGPSNGKIDPSIDPIKDLGLDKAFKNLNALYIVLQTSSTDLYIGCEKTPDKKLLKTSQNTQKLNNGWTIRLGNNARSV